MAGVINLVFNASTQALVGAYGKARKQIKGMNKDLDQTVMKGKKAVTQAKILADENKRAAKNSRMLAGGVAAVAAAYATASIALQKFQALQDKSIGIGVNTQAERADFASLIALEQTPEAQRALEKRLNKNAELFGRGSGQGLKRGMQLSFLAQSAQLSDQNISNIARTGAVSGDSGEELIRVFRALKQLFPNLTVPEALGMIQVTSGQAIATFGEIAANATRPLQQGTKAGIGRSEVFGALALLTAGGTAVTEAETQATQLFNKISVLMRKGTIKGGTIPEILDQIQANPEALEFIRSNVRAESGFLGLNAPGARAQLNKGAAFTGTPEQQTAAFENFITIGNRLTGVNQQLNATRFDEQLGLLERSEGLTPGFTQFVDENARSQERALDGSAIDMFAQFLPEFFRRGVVAGGFMDQQPRGQNSQLDAIYKKYNLNQTGQSVPTPQGGQ